jgi:polysaccharide transporter, PST family
VWTLGQAVVVRLLSLVGFAVLGRLLTPAEYGLAGLASIFMSLMYLLGVTGLGTALVQRPEVDDTDLDSVFWIGTGLGGLLTIALAAAAWPLASLYHEAALRPVLQLLSVGYLFVGLGATQNAVLQRRLAFQAIARTAMIANAIATAVGIAFAFAGFGVYALVVQTVLAPMLIAVGNTLQSDYRPGRKVAFERFRSLFAYSRQLLGTSIMGFLNQRTDDFLIGSVLGPAALGVYTVGYRLLLVMNDVLATTSRNVAFPVFSKVQGDLPRLGRAYASAARMNAVIAFPCFSFALVAAPIIVPTLFGPQWGRSIPIMQILCLFGLLFAVLQFNASLLQSIGRARLVFRISLAGTILQVAFFAVAVNFGIRWVAASFVFRAYLMAPLYLIAAARAVGVRVREHLGGLVAPAVSSAVMSAAVFAVEEGLKRDVPHVALLAMLVGLGAGVFLGTLKLVGAATFDEAHGYVRSALARAPRGRAESQPV